MAREPARRPGTPTQRRGMHPLAALGTISLGMVVGLAILWGVVLALQHSYSARVMPNVTVLGQDIGGLTVPLAELRLAGLADRVDAGVATLSDGETVWEAPWGELGLVLDTAATAQAAFAIGHAPADRDPRAFLRLWVATHPVAPLLRLDAERARAVLEGLAPSVDRPALGPSLALQGATVVVTPGSPGRALDVPASLQAVVAAAKAPQGAEPVVLAFREVPPSVYDPAPLQATIDSMLARTLEVTAYDLLADRWFRWTLEREEIARWLRLEPRDGEQTIVLDRAAVAEALAPLAAEMGEARAFRQQEEEAVDAVIAAHTAGGGQVPLTVTYAPGTYTVRAGDVALGIAAAHGMPFYALAVANPEVDLNVLHVGQELVIPSQDVLTPLPPVPNKRIVVSLSEHRLRAYEDGALKFDWLAAAGRESSPTAAGTFQVLFKEESAYASAWDLTMPHFIAVYTAAPGFANGIHALPILSNGQRLWTGALGTDASYGCIILGVEEAQTLYDWAEVGVVVVIQR